MQTAKMNSRKLSWLGKADAFHKDLHQAILDRVRLRNRLLCVRVLMRPRFSNVRTLGIAYAVGIMRVYA